MTDNQYQWVVRGVILGIVISALIFLYGIIVHTLLTLSISAIIVMGWLLLVSFEMADDMEEPE